MYWLKAINEQTDLPNRRCARRRCLFGLNCTHGAETKSDALQ
jgi:hypothetical protein